MIKKLKYPRKLKSMSKINRLVSVAPMMDCTDRHERYFLRLISKKRSFIYRNDSF